MEEIEYSLKDLIDLGPSFTEDKIFMSCFSDLMQRRQGENADSYIYFSFKITVLQLGDQE